MMLALLLLRLLVAFLVLPALLAAAARTTPSPLVARLLKDLSLKQKVGQMTQLSASMLIGKDNRLDSAKARQIFSEYGVGSVLSNPRHGCINSTTSASSVAAWREIVGEYQRWVLSSGSSPNATTPPVPLLWGLDSTHGAGYIDHATLFPHSFGAVAAFRPEYIERQATITMLDSRAAGIPWIFSPILGLANNPLWSRFCACLAQLTAGCQYSAQNEMTIHS
jgi:beta-glucosidase